MRSRPSLHGSPSSDLKIGIAFLHRSTLSTLKPNPKPRPARTAELSTDQSSVEQPARRRASTESSAGSSLFTQPQSETTNFQSLLTSTLHDHDPQHQSTHASSFASSSSSRRRGAFIPLSPSGFSGALNGCMTTQVTERDAALAQVSQLEKVVRARDEVISGLALKLSNVKRDSSALRQSIASPVGQLECAEQDGAKAVRAEDVLQEVRRGLLSQIAELKSQLGRTLESSMALEEDEEDG